MRFIIKNTNSKLDPKIKKKITKLDVIINNAAATGDVLKSEPQWEKVLE